MKKFFLTVLFSCLIFSAKANAETFKLVVSEDAKYLTGLQMISNNPDLLSSLYANKSPVMTMLKFKVSDNENLYMNLQNSEIVSVKLNIFRFRTENQPISNVMYLDSDNWEQGDWNTTHSAPFPETKKENLIGMLPEVAAGVSYQGWTFADLDIAKFLADTDGTYSLLLFNTNYQARFDGLDSIDQFLNKETYAGNFPSYLEIETAPVPEPSSMILGIMGLGSLFGLRRKKA